MTGAVPIHLGGGLSAHARGRTLVASFGPTIQDVPHAGCVFVLGKEFQNDEVLAQRWVTWASAPGRLLVILPPFERGACSIPAEWEARRAESFAGGDTLLGRLLAGERRHEIRGRLLPFEKTAGEAVTVGWRKHSATGLVVITALPIWSLTALDHKAECDEWLDGLYDRAGATVAALDDEQAADSKGYQPSADEWTLLLHLCTGPFGDAASALNALRQSNVHRLSVVAAADAHASLTRFGLVDGGSLTNAGEQSLLDGPYAPYARALRRTG